MTVRKTVEQKVLCHLRKSVIPRITYNTFDNNYYENGEVLNLKKLAHNITDKIGTVSVQTLDSMLQQEVTTNFNVLTDMLTKCYLEYGQNDSVDYLCDNIFKCGSEIEKIYVRKFLIGAVARAFAPGCELHTMLILYTPKGGYRKTRFFRNLVEDRYCYDAEYSVNNIELRKTCSNFWLVLFDEIDDGLTPNKLSSFKKFITETKDTWREYYTTSSQVIRPRQYALCGTTNKKELLIDTTEERRFWVVDLKGRIDIDWVVENRDKIWAQAVYLYRSGEQWWLTDDQQEVSNTHVKQFKKTNAYDDEIVETALAFEEPFTLKMLAEQLNVPEVGYQKFSNYAKSLLTSRTNLKYPTKPSRNNGAMGRWWKNVDK
jgi:predicted P-loop ATPase